MFKSIFVFFVMYLFVSLSSASAADWKHSDEVQSKVYLSLSLNKVYAETGWDDSYSIRRYRIFVRDNSTSDPRSEVYFNELAPNRYYSSINSPKQAVSLFGYFKSGHRLISEEKSDENHRVKYVVVDKNNRKCLVFVGASGMGGGDFGISKGSAVLQGYFCIPVGQNLDLETTKKILNSIGLKKVGAAVPPSQPFSTSIDDIKSEGLKTRQKNKQHRSKTSSFSLGNSGKVRLAGGNLIPLTQLPFMSSRPKIQGFYKKAAGQSFSLAIATAPCSSYSYSSWGREDTEKHAVKMCNVKMGAYLIDYPQEIIERCGCNQAIRNNDVVDKNRLNDARHYSIVKLYITDKQGKTTTQRGFLEYEAPELVKQKSQLFNQEFKQICEGNLDPAFGDGGFSLSCFGGTMNARGVLKMKDLFGKQHSIGKATINTGEKFAFITGLTDSQIEKKYPKFPFTDNKNTYQESPREDP